MGDDKIRIMTESLPVAIEHGQIKTANVRISHLSNYRIVLSAIFHRVN
jgi:hypothetical protein